MKQLLFPVTNETSTAKQNKAPFSLFLFNPCSACGNTRLTVCRMVCRVAFRRGRMAGIKALAGDTTALQTEITGLRAAGTTSTQQSSVCSFALPLGSRYHLCHGALKVFVSDDDGVNVQNQFLG